jgi:DNA-binding MarR family transcriptional regulator
MPAAPPPSRRRPPEGPAKEPGPARLDDQIKELLAAMLDFTSAQRFLEASERPAMGLGRAMQRHGLTSRHSSALLTIALYGPMTITQLAERQRIRLKAASLAAVELEQAGMIERREDPADRRRTIVAIPKSKERAINQGLINRAAHLQRTLDQLTAEQRDGLITGLRTLAAEMSPDLG